MVLHDIPPLDYDLTSDSLAETRGTGAARLRSGEELLAVVTDPATWERQLEELPPGELAAALREELRGTHAR